MKAHGFLYFFLPLWAVVLNASDVNDITLKIVQSNSQPWSVIATIDNPSNTALIFEANEDMKTGMSILADARCDMNVGGKWRQIVVYRCALLSGNKFKVESGSKGTALVSLGHLEHKLKTALPVVIRLRVFELSSMRCLYSNEIEIHSERRMNFPRPGQVEKNREDENADSSSICSFEKLHPEEAIREYKVCAGDTGYKIARMFYMSFSELEEINPNKQWKLLQIGEAIRVRLPRIRKIFSDLSEKELLSGIEKARKMKAKYCILGYNTYQLIEDEDLCFLTCYIGGVWCYKKEEETGGTSPAMADPRTWPIHISPSFTLTWYPDLPVENPEKVMEIHRKIGKGFEVYLYIVQNPNSWFYYGVPIRGESFSLTKHKRAKELVKFLSVLRKKQLYPLPEE
jgi:LysM repeat protein